MIKFKNSSKIVFAAFVIIILYSFNLSAQAEPQPRPLSPRAQALQEKRQQFQQEAAAAAPEVEAECTKFISYINSGLIPDDANVNTSLKIIARNRKFLPVFTEQQKGVYFTLASWVYYFDKKQDKAIKQASMGRKAAGQNLDMLKTHLALSMIYKDFNSVPQILTPVAAKAVSPVEQSGMPQEISSYQQPENILNLDVNSIRSNLLGMDFDIRPTTVDKDVLCVLLWQIDTQELDRFAPPKPASPNEPNEPNDPNNPPAAPAPEPMIYDNPVMSEPQPIPDITAFSNLQSRFAKNQKAVFIGINFNDPDKIENIKNWLTKNPQPWQIIPPVAVVQQQIASFLGQKPEKPVLLITGPDSKIRYVGDVNSFLPQMIIRSILSNPLEFAEPNDVNKPSVAEPLPTLQVEETNTVKTAPPPAVKETPATPAPTTPPPATTKNESEEDFSADDYQAITLLENAKMLFKIGNRLQHHTYGKPIEICRRVIRDYPNTKYAEQARVLMRNVPERFRDRFHITNEELGL